MVGAFGAVGAFGFYAGMNVLALIMIFFLMPGMNNFLHSVWRQKKINIFLTILFFLKIKKKRNNGLLKN